MAGYPPHIYAALAAMGLFDEEHAAAYLTAFTAAWGSFEPPSLRRSFAEGGEFDRLFALWALAATHAAEAREFLLPLLESQQSLERWASALALVEDYHDERALPMLERMLSEMLPPYSDTHRIAILDIEYQASEHYFSWRHEIPDLLGDWGEATSVPALRAGLQAALRVELALDDLKQRHVDEAGGIIGSVRDWTDFEDSVVYAMGRLGGFGALAGIEGAETPRMRWPRLSHLGLPQSHLDHWRIQLIMGSLHGQYALERLDQWRLQLVKEMAQGRYTIERYATWQWTPTPEPLSEVNRRLERIFGLEPSVYMPALEQYVIEMGLPGEARRRWRRTDGAPHDSG